jgi:hypothetical protein
MSGFPLGAICEGWTSSILPALSNITGSPCAPACAARMLNLKVFPATCEMKVRWPFEFSGETSKKTGESSIRPLPLGEVRNMNIRSAHS